MRTLVTLENSNCTWCHNAMLRTLREEMGVQRVLSDFSSGCVVIEHETDPDALLTLVTTADRAVAVAGNGEREMVPVAGHEAVACRKSKDIVGGPPDEGRQVLAATSPDEAGAKAFIPRSRSDTWSKAVPVCPVCHPGGPSTGEGVRVLTRERPTPGLVRRTIRLLVRAYRAAFRLPMTPR
ncbi:MAG TPA: hypothetical protein VFN73_00070 [Propionibacteriaceae bacterium]|jgi:hypothetical protein|nr:hypothetical protein [Propionibacteriaceae bacterium]